MKAAHALLAVLCLSACSPGPSGPAPLDTRNESCAWCRMTVSDRRFAAQLTAPGAEPKFFDDLGCLGSWLKEPREKAPWTAWVSDHRTREFVPAATAVFCRSGSVQTPMGSGLIAHRDAASRGEDPEARDASPVGAEEVFGPSGPPRGGE